MKVKKEKLILEKENFAALMFGDDIDDFKFIQSETIDELRWCIIKRVICQRLSDNKYFAGCFEQAATEAQEHDFIECMLEEVTKKEKIITIFE